MRSSLLRIFQVVNPQIALPVLQFVDMLALLTMLYGRSVKSSTTGTGRTLHGQLTKLSPSIAN
jgi:hypothetical protein